MIRRRMGKAHISNALPIVHSRKEKTAKGANRGPYRKKLKERDKSGESAMFAIREGPEWPGTRCSLTSKRGKKGRGEFMCTFNYIKNRKI